MRMHFRFVGDQPVCPGNSRRTSADRRWITFAPQPTVSRFCVMSLPTDQYRSGNPQRRRASVTAARRGHGRPLATIRDGFSHLCVVEPVGEGVSGLTAQDTSRIGVHVDQPPCGIAHDSRDLGMLL